MHIILCVFMCVREKGGQIVTEDKIRVHSCNKENFFISAFLDLKLFHGLE